MNRYQLFPPLAAEELALLERDILARGVLVPVELDEEGNVLDGYHRLAIAERHGLECPRLVRTFGTEEEKRAHVVMLNMARRHLQPHAWGRAFAKFLELRGVETRRGPKSNGAISATVAEIAEELGIPERTARHRLALARQYEELPEKKRAAVDSGDASIEGAARSVREEEKAVARAANAERVAEAADPATLEGVYTTLVLDPPWQYGEDGDHDVFGKIRPGYAQMSEAEIAALPVPRLAADDAHLYLWIPNRQLLSGLAWRLCEAWGFRPITILTWCKPGIGVGTYYRNNTEHVVFAVRGSLRLARKDMGTWFTAPRGPRGHSSKPPAFYDLIESCSPGPYLEMFARSERPGWMSWGAEVRPGRRRRHVAGDD